MATQQGLDEKELFVKTLTTLSGPAITAAIARGLERERATGNEQPIEVFIQEVFEELLRDLYTFVMGQPMLSMAMIPLMAHLRKMAAQMGYVEKV